MKLFILKEKKCGIYDNLLDKIKAGISVDEIRCFNSPNSLISDLRNIENRNTFLILLINTYEQLEYLISLRDLLLEFKKIIVLPDNESITTAKGHLLHPRFLTFVDSNLDNVVPVLDKMIKNSLHVTIEA